MPIDKSVAVLPVQCYEAFVDLLEQGAGARLTLIGAVGDTLTETAVRRRGLASRLRATRHVEFEPAVPAQLE